MKHCSLAHKISMVTALLALFACNKPNAASSASPTSTASASLFVKFPGLSLDGLTKQQGDFFIKFANEEICPCDCPKTFAACLQTETCKPAKLLAQWMIDRLREGTPADLLTEGVSKEINRGFTAKPVTIDIAGYSGHGSAKPEIIIVEFADFECAHCKIASNALQSLISKYPNRLRLIFKHFPLPAHKWAKKAAIAAEAAAQAGKFWEMHEALFATQAVFENDLFLGNAKAIGLNAQKFEKNIHNKEVVARVENSFKEAQKLKLEGTPSLYFNGRPYFLSLDMSGFELRVAMEEARKSARCN